MEMISATLRLRWLRSRSHPSGHFHFDNTRKVIFLTLVSYLETCCLVDSSRFAECYLRRGCSNFRVEKIPPQMAWLIVVYARRVYA